MTDTRNTTQLINKIHQTRQVTYDDIKLIDAMLNLVDNAKDSSRGIDLASLLPANLYKLRKHLVEMAPEMFEATVKLEAVGHDFLKVINALTTAKKHAEIYSSYMNKDTRSQAEAAIKKYDDEEKALQDKITTEKQCHPTPKTT